jgi:hypothetical protein
MAKTDAGQIRTRSALIRWSVPRRGLKSFSKDSMIRGTIAPVAPNSFMTRRSPSGFGRTALYGVAADRPSLAGPCARAERAPGLRSCRLGSFCKFASTVQQPFACLEVTCCSSEPIAPLASAGASSASRDAGLAFRSFGIGDRRYKAPAGSSTLSQSSVKSSILVCNSSTRACSRFRSALAFSTCNSLNR